MIIPPEVGEGTAKIKWLLREYLSLDLSADGLPSVIDLLPAGKNSIIDEGNLSERTPLCVVISTGPSGYTEVIPSWSLQRFLVYAMAPERGLSDVETLISRMQARLNRTSVVRRELEIAPTEDFRIEHIVANATTDTSSYPAWKKEGRGLYVFVTVSKRPTNSEF